MCLLLVSKTITVPPSFQIAEDGVSQNTTTYFSFFRGFGTSLSYSVNCCSVVLGEMFGSKKIGVTEET
jgi:hypothetical protein